MNLLGHLLSLKANSITRYPQKPKFLNFKGFDLTWRRILVGFECAFFTMLFNYPYEMLRTRIHCDLLKPGASKKDLLYNAVIKAGSNVKNDEGGNFLFFLILGFRAFYKGISFSSFAIIPQVTATTLIYNTVINLEEKRGQKIQDILGFDFSVPLVAVALSSVICHPFDTIK